jgi:ABC-type multidrug transport system fused ATPase/permease subunit
LGVVSQQPTLFDMSVSENIRYGSFKVKADEMATTANMFMDVDIRTAAKWAIHQVIMALGDGYDTVFGTNTGGGLSGGRAQRVQIA